MTATDLSNDLDLALFDEADLDALFQPDSGIRFEVPAERNRHTDALQTACLAVRQTGCWGTADPDVGMSESRLARAVAAATEAAETGADEKQAIAAAVIVLGGPEAAEAFGLAIR